MSAVMKKQEAVVIPIPTSKVRPFKEQPREYFDAGELLSLELSIKQRGQLQPAMVRVIDGDKDHDYELVDGQRRWHACSKLGVPLLALVIDPEDPEDQFEISVAANFQRAEHTPMEIAKAIERMCEQGGRTEQYVANLFGKHVTWVNQIRNLVDLVPEVQAQLDPGAKQELPVSIAIQLARLPKEQQLSTLEEIRARGLSSHRAADKIRRILLDGAPERTRKSSTHDRILQRYIRRTIQDADRMFDRVGPDEFRLMVNLLHKKKSLEDMRESIMTAIGRLEILHRRLTECKPDKTFVEPTPPPAPPPIRSNQVGSQRKPEPIYVYSHPMKCPKCNTVNARFKRRANADVGKDYWVCEVKGCLLKISHYNIRIDRSYQPPATPSAVTS